MDIYINGKLNRLSASKSIGKGGEADVFDLGNGHVAKIYKQPTHPDLDGLPHEQQAAADRIAQHQTKLKSFPKNLPARVVAPVDLVTDKPGKVIGYTMPFVKPSQVLLRYSERGYRSSGGIDANVVVRIFRDLHETVAGIHKAGVVAGDFNDLNILVSNEQAYVIDADSFQFGQFLCGVFTARFVDPMLCDQKLTTPSLVKPHNAMSDWYAFNVMLMQCLLYVGPYGGVYKPAAASKRIAHDARPLHRVTVWNKEVKYPKPAIHYNVLPDDLLEHFHRLFHKDERKPFPEKLLEMQWITCKCGAEFARHACPSCAAPAPGVVKEATVIRGTVTCKRVFKTSGRILFAVVQGDKLLYLYNEDGCFKREGDKTISKGKVDPQMRFRISGENTLIAVGHTLATLKDGQPEQFVVDTCRQVPMFDGTIDKRFWISGGRLMKDGAFGIPEVVGQVLADQTSFWVGEHLGFGFYRAGEVSVAFMFRTNSPGLNDGVKLPPIRGQLLHAMCYFAKTLVWFAISTQDGGVIKNQMFAIDDSGAVVATAEARDGDGSWLGSLRGKSAFGKWLFSATDDGIVRLEIDQKKIVVTKEFPDTEPFVDAGCHLFVSVDGMHVVTSQEIRLLRM